MQTYPVKSSNLSQVQPIAAYLGRQIFLSRVVIDNVDRGLWLHWYDPGYQGKATVKHGQVIPPNISLEEVLQLVYQRIEATIELEMMPDNLLSFPAIANLSKAS